MKAILILFTALLTYPNPTKKTAELAPINKQEENKNKRHGFNYSSAEHKYIPYIQKLDSIHYNTPLFAVIDTLTFYFIADNFSIRKATKMGMVDEVGNILLPKEYSKIMNPNATMNNCVEIEQGNKYGLFNFMDKKILQPDFDYIYPSTDNSNICYGVKTDKTYLIQSDLSVIEYVGNSEDTLFQLKDIKTFMIPNPNEVYLYDSYDYNNTFEELKKRKLGYFSPSYINRFHYIPQFRFYTMNSHGDSDKFQVEVIEELASNSNLKIVLVKVLEKNMPDYSAETFNDSSYHITTLKKDKPIDTKEIFKVRHDNHHRPDGAFKDAKFMDDKYIISSYETDKIKFNNYSTITYHEIYSINDNSYFEKLSNNRFFSFTKYVEIDSTFFQGRYKKHTGTSDFKNYYWLEYYDLTHHLTINDLDIMRNEIFADYGYRFKTEKWKDYFSKFNYYTPQYDDVNHLLTDIDKKNIEFILRYKKRMLDKEEEFLKREKISEHHDTAG